MNFFAKFSVLESQEGLTFNEKEKKEPEQSQYIQVLFYVKRLSVLEILV